MFAIELLLLLSLCLFPAIELHSGGNTKRRIQEGKITKVRAYQETIVMLLLPTLLLVFLLIFGELRAFDLGLAVKNEISQTIAFLLLLVVLCYYATSFCLTFKNEQTKRRLREQLASLNWMLPTTSKEVNWFVFGVSLVAGVCEELLFRGYLIHTIDSHWGMAIAIILSSALFGLCHVYQGWINVLRTGLVGLFLAIVYVWSGSLIVVIVLHIAQDAYVGALHFVVSKTKQPQ
ncbi:CPBP family intramembrane glutamic endopeptidase [Alteromonas gracilis]|uniref:CPBP family intramembrane glutamic endopeptidase n=1 Tax=Alteromonas gracilis TaxID=1479524 RepID=UPI0030CBF00D